MGFEKPLVNFFDPVRKARDLSRQIRNFEQKNRSLHRRNVTEPGALSLKQIDSLPKFLDLRM